MRLDSIQALREVEKRELEAKIEGLTKLRALTNSQHAEFADKNYLEAKLRALEAARILAEADIQRRLDRIHEHDRDLEEIRKEISQLKEFKAVLDSKASQRSFYVSIGLSLIAIIVTIVVTVWTH